MADTVYSYQIDGTLADGSGNTRSIDGSFQVDYTTGTVSNVNISGYNTGSLSSSSAQNGTTEYSVSLRFFPEAQYVVNYATITYNTVAPGFADSASETSGETSNPNGIPVGTDTYSGQDVPLVASAVSVCFAGGTRIRTSRGEVAVEALRVGDLVVTTSGEHRPIRWLGHRQVECNRHAVPANVMPVRIAAHAFGRDRPVRDLVVSPGHAIAVDLLGEVLIPASSLINGRTIRQEHVECVMYWHVELDGHDILLAENLPTESYLDMGNRDFFANGGAAVALHGVPDAAVTHDDFCRPFHAQGAVVGFVRERLAAQAEQLGWTAVADPFAGLHLSVDGRRIEPEKRGLSACFLVPAAASQAWLVSEAAVPAQVGAGADTRTLGVCLAGLSLNDGLEPERVVAVDDLQLCLGFHAVEEGPQRWTAGRALLPMSLWDGLSGAFFLRVDLMRPALPRWEKKTVVPAALARA